LERQYKLLAGIDWATEQHEVCIIDGERRIVDQRKVAHSGTEIAAFITWLTAQSGGHPETIAVAIEVPRGAIVESLVERGFHVYSINPKQLDRFRDRHTNAGAKDDRLDAFVLADSLRTDTQCFRRIRLDDPLIIKLRELGRIDEELCEEFSRLTNRLREQLHRYFPQMLAFCPAADEQWLWALWEKVQSPQAVVKRLKKHHIAIELRKHRVRRVTAEEIHRELITPALPVGPGVTEASVEHIESLLPRLRLVHQQRKECARKVEAVLDSMPFEDASGQKVEHRDVDIILSLPGVGRCITATVFAEASQPLADREYHVIRALAGTAPVTRQTGKQGQPGSRRQVSVLMRRACNPRLRNAVYHMSRVAMQRDSDCKRHYAELRGRGHSHGRALRALGDKLLRILCAMLRSRTLYRVPVPPISQPGEPCAIAA
jgi:hypothetical protein